MQCPDTIEGFEELVKEVNLCRKKVYEQVEARKASGAAKSDRDGCRQLADETGKPFATVYTDFRREKETQGKVRSVSADEKPFNFKKFREELKKDAEEMHQAFEDLRNSLADTPEPPEFDEVELDLCLALISTGFRDLSKKLHPDVGGSHTEMSRLNSVKDKLLQLIGG